MVARTIEGVFAIVLVLLAHVALQPYAPRFTVSSPNLGATAANTLMALDDSGQLPNLVLQGAKTGNWSHLSEAFAASLPSGTSYRLRIVDSSSGTDLPGTPLMSGALQGSMATVSYTVTVFDRSASRLRVFQLTLTVAPVG